MRTQATFSIVLIVAVTMTSFAQAQIGQYPWRTEEASDSGNAATVFQPEYRVAQSEATRAIQSAPTYTPAPPNMNGRAMFASSRTQEEQSVLSNADDYSFNNVPAPGSDLQEYNEQYNQQQPALSVQSNASRPEEDSLYCCRSCYQPVCNLGCPLRLLGRHRSGMDIGGWAQLGYHNRNNIMFNDRRKEANLHQLWLYFDKPATRHGGFGWRIDSVYGIDGQDLQAFGNRPTGNPDRWDNGFDNGSYGSAVPQAYLEWGNGRDTLRLGKFFSPFGAEKLPSIENFFYSHTYTRYFTEPFSHSGVIFQRQTSNQNSMILGATAGWDTGWENNGGFTVLTGMRRQVNENVSIQTTGSFGDTGHRGSGTLGSFIANMKLLPRLNYVFQTDVLNLDDNQEFGVVQYLFFNRSDCLGFGARLEWWKSDQLFVDTKSTWDFTVGANYRPHANVLLRPEARIDWGAGAIDPGAVLLGIDAIILF